MAAAHAAFSLENVIYFENCLAQGLTKMLALFYGGF